MNSLDTVYVVADYTVSRSPRKVIRGLAAHENLIIYRNPEEAIEALYTGPHTAPESVAKGLEYDKNCFRKSNDLHVCIVFENPKIQCSRSWSTDAITGCTVETVLTIRASTTPLSRNTVFFECTGILQHRARNTAHDSEKVFNIAGSYNLTRSNQTITELIKTNIDISAYHKSIFARLSELSCTIKDVIVL